jgi:shikimate kinase
MGAGKSTVGPILAQRLGGWHFLDFDAEIERRAGASVAEIFRTRGELAFRALEAELTRELSSVSDTVLAPGGGWAAMPGAFDALPAGTITVWLRVDLDTAVQRALASGVQRPLLDVGDPREAARALLAEREPFYARATHVVDAGMAPDRVADEILKRIGT